MNVNICMFGGRLTRDPESTVTNTNTKITKFGMAINGRKEGEVTFIDCVAFGKQAELIEEYVKKGQRLFLTGRLVIESWNDASGNKRTSPKIYVDTFQFVDGSSSNSTSAEETKTTKKTKKAKVEDTDEDVPF